MATEKAHRDGELTSNPTGSDIPRNDQEQVQELSANPEHICGPPVIITELPEALEDFPPAAQDIRSIEVVAPEWRWVLKWWAALVTALYVHIPIFVILVGAQVLTLPDPMFITYVAATTGGNTLLAIAGILVLRPFSILGK